MTDEAGEFAKKTLLFGTAAGAWTFITQCVTAAAVPTLMSWGSTVVPGFGS